MLTGKYSGRRRAPRPPAARYCMYSSSSWDPRDGAPRVCAVSGIYFHIGCGPAAATAGLTTTTTTSVYRYIHVIVIGIPKFRSRNFLQVPYKKSKLPPVFRNSLYLGGFSCQSADGFTKKFKVICCRHPQTTSALQLSASAAALDQIHPAGTAAASSAANEGPVFRLIPPCPAQCTAWPHAVMAFQHFP